jgi:hypothetical protein
MLESFCNNLDPGIATKDLGEILFTRSAEKEVNAITRYVLVLLFSSAANAPFENTLNSSTGDRKNKNKYLMKNYNY